jgi:hypothetical protein
MWGIPAPEGSQGLKGVVMESRIRIKIGPFEAEGEGTETFIKDTFPDIVSAVLDLHRNSHLPVPLVEAEQFPPADTTGVVLPAVSVAGTTKTMAAKLGVKSGADLLLAAAAHLTFVAEHETFSRQQLLDDAKTASGYCNRNFSKNLSNYLDSAIKQGKLIETAAKTYTLTSQARSQMEAQLASS